MPSSKITDYDVRCLEFLASQFNDADNLKGFIQAIIESVQDCEDVAYDLLIYRINISIAEGIQLDNIGTIVGVSRNGLSDIPYRFQLYYAIMRNSSKPTPDEIVQAIKYVTFSTYMRYWELIPAAFQLHFDGDVPLTGGTPAENNALFVELVDNMAPAGVNIELVKEYEIVGHEPFVFANDDKTDPARGGGFAELGGGFDQGFFSERIV